MTGFIVERQSPALIGPAGVGPRAPAPVISSRPHRAMVLKGLRQSAVLAVGEVLVALYANPWQDPWEEAWRNDRGDFLVHVGTLFYRGLSGTSANRSLGQALTRNELDSHLLEIQGTSTIICAQEGVVRVLTDRSGQQHVYQVGDGALVTNSFTSAVASMAKRTPLTQGVYEYLLHAANFGEQTYVEGVRLLPPAEQVTYDRSGFSTSPGKTHWDGGFPHFGDPRDEVRRTHEVCTAYFESLSSAFEQECSFGMTGGYDSRLVLGLVLEQQRTPYLYVYGSGESIDVRLGIAVGDSVGIPVHHVEKSKLTRPSAEEYAAGRTAALHSMDGLGSYGYLCEPHEISTRRSRVDNGMICINGSGGEVWRDFWEMADRGCSALTLVRDFYEGERPQLLTSVFDRTAHFKAMAHKMVRSIRADSDKFSKRQAEAAYPQFRLRFWHGRNVSTNLFFGRALAPLVEDQVIFRSASIPMRYKQNAWFERELLQSVSPSLALLPLRYGWNVVEGPGYLARARAWAMRQSPPLVKIVARQMRHAPGSRPYYLSGAHLGQLNLPRQPEIARYVNLDRCNPLMFSRAMTMEKVLFDLDSTLADTELVSSLV